MIQVDQSLPAIVHGRAFLVGVRVLERDLQTQGRSRTQSARHRGGAKGRKPERARPAGGRELPDDATSERRKSRTARNAERRQMPDSARCHTARKAEKARHRNGAKMRNVTVTRIRPVAHATPPSVNTGSWPHRALNLLD